MLSLEAFNIYDVIKPLHFNSKLIGLAAFNIRERNGKFEASTTFFNWICLSFMTSLYIAMIIMMATNLEDIKFENQELLRSEVLLQAFATVSFAYFVILTFSSWWYFAHQKHFASLITTLHDVDGELCLLRVPIDFRNQKLFVLGFVCWIKIAIVILAYLNIFTVNLRFNKDHKTLTWLALCLSLDLSVHSSVHFTFWMWSVKMRYGRVNLFLQRNFLNPLTGRVFDGKALLVKAAQVHDKLVDCSEIINRCYGFPVKATTDCNYKKICSS